MALLGALAQAKIVENTLRPEHFSCANEVTGGPVLLMSPVTKFEKRLTERLKDRHFPLIYIARDTELAFPRYAGNFDANNFLGGIVYSGDFTDVVRTMKAFPLPRVIFPGAEFSVPQTESLRKYLNHPIANVHELIDTHWDKAALGQLLRTSGLPFAKEVVDFTIEGLLAKRADVLPYPVILKPLSGMGSHNVFLCESDADVRQYAPPMLVGPNIAGRLDGAIMLQEDLKPIDTEFVVDFISSGGDHKVFVSARYFRERVQGSGYMLKGGELIDPASALGRILIHEGKKRLNVMGIRYGYTHLEMIWTPRGFVLTDVGARFSGTFPSLGLTATGEDPIDWVIEAFLEPEKFRLRPDVARLKKHAGFVAIRSHEDGSIFREMSHAETERELKEKYGIEVSLYDARTTPGAVLGKTIDLLKLPLIIEVTGKDRRTVNESRRKLMDLDAQGYFVRRPSRN